MSKRICVSCHALLKSSDHFFCGSCGAKLPEENVVSPSFKPKIIDHNIHTRHGIPGVSYYLHELKKIPLHYLVIGIFLFFCLIVVTVNLLLLNPYSQVFYRMTPKVTSQAPVVPSCAGKYLCGDFGLDSLYEYIPYDATFLVEGFDFGAFSALALKTNPEIENLINELSGMNIRHFGVYKTENSWTFVGVPGAFAEVSEKGDLIDGFYISKVGSVIVASLDKNMTMEVEKNKNRLQKNLALNPDFVSGISKMQKNGQFFMFSFTTDTKKTILGYPQENWPEEAKSILSAYESNAGLILVF